MAASIAFEEESGRYDDSLHQHLHNGYFAAHPQDLDPLPFVGHETAGAAADHDRGHARIRALLARHAAVRDVAEYDGGYQPPPPPYDTHRTVRLRATTEE